MILYFLKANFSKKYKIFVENNAIYIDFYFKILYTTNSFKIISIIGGFMTKTKISKTKSILIAVLTFVLALSMVFFTACKKTEDDNKTTNPNYTKIENDEQELTNGNFEFGVYDVSDEDYPYTSINGWTRAVDNSAQSSKVNSGIISLQADKLKATYSNMLETSAYLDWAKEQFKTDVESFAPEGIDEDSEEYEEKLIEMLADKIVESINITSTEANNVLMLNNYSDTLGLGTAQKVTSSKSFTIKASEYAKFTVSVKTAFLKPLTNDGEYGANIRLVTTVAGITQDEYSISNIISNDNWTKYEIYVKGVDFAETTVKLVVGLGYGSGNSSLAKDYVEGTAFFDNCAYEEITENDYTTAISTNVADTLSLVNKSSSERVDATLVNNVAFLDLTSNYFKNDLSITASCEYTTSNTNDVKGDRFGSSVTDTTVQNEFTVNSNRASTTTTVISDKFKVANESFFLIRFNVDMDLDKLQKTGLTVFVHDVYNTNETATKTLDNVIIDEETTYSIIVKNNFTDKVDNYERTFYLTFVFGPVADSLKSTSDPLQFPIGSVTVNNFSYQTGSLVEDNYDDSTINEYNIYSLITSSTDSTKDFTVSAFTGFSADYVDDSTETTYTFKEAYSDKGTITSKPSNVSGYKGVSDYKNTYTSSNANSNAGLINTEYSYANELDALKGAYKDNIQPIMINNVTETSYGFVSESQTIAQDTNAKISVRVRVYEDAVAYVYLVDTTKSENMLNVISHEFKGDDGKDYSNKLFVKVTADDMDYDGWATVTFYVAAGKTPISYRVEMWNGERATAEQTTAPIGSIGYVFFDDLLISSFTDESSVLSEAEENTLLTRNDYVYYTRAIDDVEKEYNDKQTSTSDMVSYKPTVVWADNFSEQGNNGTLVFAIYNTIDPTPINPNTDNEVEEDETTKQPSGCNEVDPSTFWLSFSSILLGAALIAAMIMLVVKKLKSSKKKNANDAKSHYKVTSRNKTINKVKTNKVKEDSDFDDDDEVVEEVNEEVTEDATEEETVEEEYQYGEVLEDFGDDKQETTETTEEETVEEVTEENSQDDTEKKDN